MNTRVRYRKSSFDSVLFSNVFCFINNSKIINEKRVKRIALGVVNIKGKPGIGKISIGRSEINIQSKRLM